MIRLARQPIARRANKEDQVDGRLAFRALGIPHSLVIRISSFVIRAEGRERLRPRQLPIGYGATFFCIGT